MKELDKLLSKLESKISYQEYMNPTISKASVGWHIEHSLLTLNSIITGLAASDPKKYKRRFDIRKTVVMLLGKFPRGRIRAPKTVQPTVAFNADTLHEHVLLLQERVKTLDSLSGDHFFVHPFLGDFKLKPGIRFMAIHTNHHLRIIEDIIRS